MARRGAFDTSTSQYPQYPAESRTRKYFVRRVGTFEASSYAGRVQTSPSFLSYSLSVSPSFLLIILHDALHIFGASKLLCVIGRRYFRPLRLTPSWAREKTACRLKQVVSSRLSRVSHSFLSSLRSTNNVSHFAVTFLCERVLCVPWIRVLAKCRFVDFWGFFNGLPIAYDRHRVDNFWWVLNFLSIFFLIK